MCTASALCPLCGRQHDAAMPCPETSPTACACPTAHEHARHEDGHAHCACGHDHAPAAPLDPHAFGVPSATRAVYRITNMDCPVELSEIKKLYNEYYDDHNFTFVSDRMPDLKDVVNTNKCLLYLTKEDGKLLIVSVIDNLLKGASGQAVHNMNLLFGLHERVGLQLKASAF